MRFDNVVELALEELAERSKKAIYQHDFQAWKSDVLGFRTYEKMQEIWDTALFGDTTRTFIKSANGTAKSFEMACAIAWVGSVFPPGDAISIISAPSVSQIEKVIFSYLKTNYSLALRRHELKIPNSQKLPGWISEDLQWKFQTSGGNKLLAFGKKPADQSAVSIFQGVRSETGYTYVFFDEAGGMARSMYTAAEAVMTGGKSRFVGIGNPDNAGTEFQQYFTDKKYEGEVNRFTLSAFDLPTLTGERVYPKTSDGDAMEAKMLQALTQASWVEHKKRIWGEKDARYLAKVLGEFPGDGDNAFFGQRALDVAYDAEIPDDSSNLAVLGVDIARFGQDESVVYCNQGGRIRLVDSWGKQDTVFTSRRVHEIANRLGAIEVRIDAAGIGGGVFDQLTVLDEFKDKNYMLIGIDGGTSSPDISRWANSRAYNHDSLRTQMLDQIIDLDYEDSELREQLLGVTYKFNSRGAIQITPKDDMKTVMDGSPDRLDAVIYAAVDLSWLTRNPLASAKAGDIIVVDPYEMLGLERDGAGLPG